MKNLEGVFTPQTDQDALDVQKMAIVLGYAWRKAGAKPIALSEGQSIRFKEDGGMTPVSGKEGTLSYEDIVEVFENFLEGKLTVQRGQLIDVYNVTKCREIENEIRTLLQDNLDKGDDDVIVIPQELVDRAVAELDDEQKAYFEDAGIYLPESDDDVDFLDNDDDCDCDYGVLSDYTVTAVVGGLPNSDPDARVQILGDSAAGLVLMDESGVVYFGLN